MNATPPPPAAPRLPAPRGPVSAAVVAALRSAPGTPVVAPSVGPLDLLEDDDAQLALTCCYELAYSGFRGVDDRWEHDLGLVALRTQLERAFVRSIERALGPVPPVDATNVSDTLRGLTTGDGPSLSTWVAEHGTLAHVREFCVHRSLYQLKEADPHTWVIPRLRGRAKAAFITIQLDEYGNGRLDDMHSELFATTMRSLGLDDRYGAYLDVLPAATLATGNLVTMFGLHRRWRAAAVGHLALFEMTSVGPMSRYAAVLARLGVPDAARRFYDVHVEADAVHERIALDELIAGLVESEPATAPDIAFGARALAVVESRLTASLLDAWAAGGSALRPSETAARRRTGQRAASAA